MKLNLFESGIQNIRELAKQYHKAMIYYHMDLDGICSAISMKYYLQQYGITTVRVQKIQYGSMEYAIDKPESSDILPVLVDFSHGKIFMKIHTDHHDGQISYNQSSSQFRHSKSNAETISSVISASDIFPPEDIRVISMIDSAGFKSEGIQPWDMIKAIFKQDNTKSVMRNHMDMGMVAGKLLLSYKNKPGYLDTIVMESKPSLQSMLMVMMRIIKEHIADGDRGWVSPEQINKNSKKYYDEQSLKKIPDMTIDKIEDMKNGESGVVGNTIIQLGGGYMGKAGSFDRYTAFRLYPDSKYFIMMWHAMGLLQVSKNPWGNEQDDLHLGHLVLDDIFKRKYVPLLSKPKYNISLLAIKMAFEKDLIGNIDKEQTATGFDINELYALFEEKFDFLSDKQRYCIEKYMNWKPSQFIPDENNEKKNNEIEKAISLLSKFYIPLPKIIMKSSGGHPGITNLSGLNFIDTQQGINASLQKGANPFIKAKSYKKPDEERQDRTVTKIMKSIAKDIAKALNNQ